MVRRPLASVIETMLTVRLLVLEPVAHIATTIELLKSIGGGIFFIPMLYVMITRLFRSKPAKAIPALAAAGTAAVDAPAVEVPAGESPHPSPYVAWYSGAPVQNALASGHASAGRQ